MLNDFDEFSTGVRGESQWDHVEIGNTEIGAVEKAFKKVIKKARDNRRPAPRMEAVEVEAPQRDVGREWALANVAIGAAQVTGNPDPFPLLSGFLLRFGAGGEPRFVRVDTERSYRNFRTESSPEMAELRARLNELSQRLTAHEADPYAHTNALANDEDLSLLGEAVQRAEADKRIDLWMPKRFKGLWEAWREGDFVCASLKFPGADGQVRICTSLEPVRKCIAEIARHASEAEVPASTIVGILPAMGCVLGAATAMKEMAASAKSILKHPSATGQRPFVLRLEPKANPALCALVALAQECRDGNTQACDEWQRLSAASPKPIQQLMGEAQLLVQAA